MAEGIDGLVHAHAGAVHGAAPLLLGGQHELGFERRVDHVGDELCGWIRRQPASAGRDGPVMPTGVALTMPATCSAAAGLGRRARSGRRRSAREIGAQLPSRAPGPGRRSAASPRPGPSARRRPRARRRRRPAAAPACRATASAPKVSMKAARKPERSVLWPVVRPFLSITTVLTAPISRRLGRDRIEQRDHRFLERIGDVDAGEARGARRGQQVLRARGPAGCRRPSDGSGRRRRPRRRHPHAAPATATAGCWRRSGRPACVTSSPPPPVLVLRFSPIDDEEKSNVHYPIFKLLQT